MITGTSGKQELTMGEMIGVILLRNSRQIGLLIKDIQQHRTF